ncbi:hypothetical protein GSI_12493 [Ganoderma sinense ZZ0214-1]|uniref:DUF6534 domain-containing protein n=1 Tax=Ganoderma sinense ZZ0214-1 TaxID=1077348 RepID=A0A2G8RSW9_9APHY|nr:hypothetical protein GSI_12493 [Ganoderma sinense ZZ0214-1]
MSLVPTFGAVLIGDMISAGLYGLTTLQVYLYFQNCWNTDPPRLKAFIFYVWILETVHVLLIGAFIFRSLITEFGNAEALNVTRVSDDVTTAITGLIIFSVHLFYTRRLWILSEGSRYRVVLTATVMILAITHFGLELAVMVLTFKFPEFAEFHKITAAYTGSLGVAAGCDIIIAIAMWHFLHSRRSGLKSTNTMVNRIITFVVITGSLTRYAFDLTFYGSQVTTFLSVVDLAILICFVAMPNNLVYLSMYNLVNNLYANSLLAM